MEKINELIYLYTVQAQRAPPCMLCSAALLVCSILYSGAILPLVVCQPNIWLFPKFVTPCRTIFVLSVSVNCVEPPETVCEAI